MKEREPEPPSGINPKVDRDLQTICLKCLQKDPDRRYALGPGPGGGPGPLAPRRANRRPARHPRRALWRWCRRNPVVASLSASVFLLMLTGLIGLTISNRMIAKRNTQITLERNEAVKAREETSKALLAAEESRREAESVSRFLVDVFRGPDPEKDGREVKAVDLLEPAVAKLQTGSGGSPRIRGRLLDALGQSYLGLGLTSRAIETLSKSVDVRESSLGPDDSDTISGRFNLARAYRAAGRVSEAITVFETNLQHYRDTLGPDDEETLNCVNCLGSAYTSAGRLDKAIELHETNLKKLETKLGLDNERTLASRNNLAFALKSSGRTAEAVVLFEANLKLVSAKFGEDHPHTLMTRSNLANAYQAVGRTREAISLHEGTLERKAVKLGLDHPDTLASRQGLAMAYGSAGRLADAVRLLETNLKPLDSAFGSYHVNTIKGRNSLADAYIAGGEMIAPSRSAGIPCSACTRSPSSTVLS